MTLEDMTLKDRTKPKPFNVIPGGMPEQTADSHVPLPDILSLSSSEIAANLAELFALALMRDVPLQHLHNPHFALGASKADAGDLQNVLCELRCLGWYNETVQVDEAALSRASPDDADHRRALSRNSDGQLTLLTLMGAGVANAVSPPGQSAAFFPIDWAGEAPQNLRELAQALTQCPPGKIFKTLSSFAQEQAVPPKADLQIKTPEDLAQDLAALFAKAESLSAVATRAIQARSVRMNRPSVLSARISTTLARDAQDPSNMTQIEEISQELVSMTPDLLDWVSRANENNRRPSRFRANLFLPILDAEEVPPHPCDIAGHVILAGALGTLLKAWHQTPAKRLRSVDDTSPEVDISSLVDNICADFCRASSVTASAYPAENFQELRIGQMIGLQLLREYLESRNMPANLTLTDFDGQRVDITCSARPFGQGRASLMRSGAPAHWPKAGKRLTGHLTAVS